MSPRPELNDRFKARLAKAQRVRRAIGTSVLVVCLLVGTGLAFEMIAPPASDARPAFTQKIGSITGGVASARSQFAAAASGPSSLDATVARIYRFFCPWFTDCDAPAIEFTTTTIPTAPAQPEQQSTTVATTTAPLPAPFPASAPTIINQPAIERIRETVLTVVEGSTNAAYVDARLLALANDFNSRLNQASLSRTYQAERTAENVAEATRIEALDGGVITGTISALIDTASAAIGSLTAGDPFSWREPTVQSHWARA